MISSEVMIYVTSYWSDEKEHIVARIPAGVFFFFC